YLVSLLLLLTRKPFCREQLHYDYLGNWEERINNSNIEEDLLRKFLCEKMRYSDVLINRAINKLRTTANNYNESLYTNNKNTYNWLRYGVPVQPDAGMNNETVHLIDWENIDNNHSAIAEEVTYLG